MLTTEQQDFLMRRHCGHKWEWLKKTKQRERLERLARRSRRRNRRIARDKGRKIH